MIDKQFYMFSWDRLLWEKVAGKYSNLGAITDNR